MTGAAAQGAIAGATSATFATRGSPASLWLRVEFGADAPIAVSIFDPAGHQKLVDAVNARRAAL